MLALQITEIKSFMNQLFLGEAFDHFLLSEAVFVTFSTFRIDGRLQRDYYAPDEDGLTQSDGNGFAFWRQIRPFCLELIRGKRTPLEFKIVFRLSRANVQKLVAQSGLSISADDVDGLFLNLHFRPGTLGVTTGTSIRFFTLDKTLDQVWDDMVKKYLRRIGISC